MLRVGAKWRRPAQAPTAKHRSGDCPSQLQLLILTCVLMSIFPLIRELKYAKIYQLSKCFKIVLRIFDSKGILVCGIIWTFLWMDSRQEGVSSVAVSWLSGLKTSRHWHRTSDSWHGLSLILILELLIKLSSTFWLKLNDQAKRVKLFWYQNE